MCYISFGTTTYQTNHNTSYDVFLIFEFWHFLTTYYAMSRKLLFVRENAWVKLCTFDSVLQLLSEHFFRKHAPPELSRQNDHRIHEFLKNHSRNFPELQMILLVIFQVGILKKSSKCES